MVEYVEKATLRIVDQATKPARKINKEILRVMKTAEKLERQGKKLGAIKIGLQGVERATGQVERLADSLRKIPRSKTVNVNVKIANAKPVEAQIKRLRGQKPISILVTMPGLKSTLADARALNQTLASLQKRTGIKIPVGLSGQGANGARPATGGNGGGQVPGGFGANFKNQFDPANAGRLSGRSVVFNLSGELYIAARQVAITGALAPISLDDARARVRISGRNEGEAAILEGLAEDMSRRFQAVPAAELLGASGEFTGRFGEFVNPETGAVDDDIVRRIEASFERFARNAQILSAALPNVNAQQAADSARIIETTIQQAGLASSPEQASEFANAGISAIIASGGDLSPADLKRTLQQIPQLRAGITPESFLQIALARDEGGRRSTGEFDQLASDLIRGNLNDDDKQRQIEAGFRDTEGNSLVFDQYQNNILDFVEGQVIPRLEKANVDLNDAGAIRSFLDNELGLSKQGGISSLSGLVINIDEIRAEEARAQAANPQFAIDNPTVRQQGQAVSAQFQNVAAQILEPLLPVVNSGLDDLSDGLAAVAAGEATTGQKAAVGAGVIGLGIAASAQALLNPATRPLGAAALALTSSATALATSAAALTASAAVTGLGGLGGKVKGALAGIGAAGATFLSSLPAVTVAAAVVPTSTAGADEDENRPGGSTEAFFDQPIEVQQAQIDFQEAFINKEPDAFLQVPAIPDSYTSVPVGSTRVTNDQEDILDDLRDIVREISVARESGQTDVVTDLANEKFDTVQEALEIGLDRSQIETILNETGPTALEQSLGTGATLLDEVATQFGPEVGQAMLDMAPQIGQVIAQAIADSVANTPINIPQAAQTPSAALIDTGAF